MPLIYTIGAMEMLLTVEQVAERLQLHPETIRRQLNAGVLRGVRRGRQWRVPESALTEPTPAKEFSREEAISKGYGFLKGRIRSSDVFLEEKHAESERERQRDEARSSKAAA